MRDSPSSIPEKCMSGRSVHVRVHVRKSSSDVLNDAYKPTAMTVTMQSELEDHSLFERS